jgi:hypothetical protein
MSLLHLLAYTYVFFIRLAHHHLACTSCDVSIARCPNSWESKLHARDHCEWSENPVVASSSIFVGRDKLTLFRDRHRLRDGLLEIRVELRKSFAPNEKLKSASYKWIIQSLETNRLLEPFSSIRLMEHCQRVAANPYWRGMEHSPTWISASTG